MAQLKSTNITGNLSVTGEIVEQGEKIKDKYTLKTYVDSLTGEDIYTDSNETSTIKDALDSLGSSITKKLDSTTAASTYETKANAITGLSVSGKTITYTKGNGTTGTITTQDTNTTYNQATSSSLGLVKIGYTESGKNYPVELNSSGQMYVNVPWTNTTYSFTNKAATLAWGTSSTIATVGGTDITVTLPSNPNTDTKVTNTVNTTTKYYVTGTTSASTNTGTQVYDTGVYVGATAGALHANTVNLDTNATMKYDSTNQCIRFIIN